MNTFIQKGKNFLKTKTFKWVKVFCISLLVLLLLLFISLHLYFEQNKENIVTEINEKINENIAGHANIGNVGYKFLTGFPNFTVVLNNVMLRDSSYAIHKRAILKAEEIEVRLNIFSLLRKKLTIDKIVLINTKIDLFKDKNGLSNSNIFKPKPKSTEPKSKVNTAIHKVEFKNVTFISENLQRNKLFHFEVASLKSTIDYTWSGWKTNVNIEVFAKSMSFNTLRGSFIKDQRIKGMLVVQFFENKNNIEVLTDRLKIGEDNFDIKASFGLEEAHPMMDIYIQTNILWLNASRLLDNRLFKILNHFNITKPLDATCSIKGDMNAEGDPEIIVVAKVKNNVLLSQEGETTACSFVGKYTNNFKNGLGNLDSNSAIIIKDFVGIHEGIPIEIPDAAVNNLDNPLATGILHSKFEVKELAKSIGEDFIKFNGGTANVDLKFKFDIVDLRISKPRFVGKINIEKANLLFKAKNLTFQTDVLLDFTEEALLIRNIKYQNDKNIVFLEGKIDNFLNLYYNEPEKMVAVLNINSPFMDVKRFMEMLTYKEHKNNTKNTTNKKSSANLLSKKRMELIQKCQVILELDLEKMVYANLTAKNAKFNVIINDSQAHIKEGEIETCGGKITFDSQMIPHANVFNMKTNVNITKVDIPQFLTSFKNFGITSFEPRNIKGNLSAKAAVTIQIDEKGNLVDGSTQGNLQYEIKKGALIDFKPIVKVGQFAFANRDVKNIVFNDLSGQLKIDGNIVNVDYFKVSSNVLNFDLEGVYSFKKGTKLGLTIPLRNPEEDFKIKNKIERDALRYKGIVVHLLVVDGKNDEMKIKLGRITEKNK